LKIGKEKKKEKIKERKEKTMELEGMMREREKKVR